MCNESVKAIAKPIVEYGIKNVYFIELPFSKSFNFCIFASDILGMNLTIDIGNTTAKIVVFQDGEPLYELVTSNETLEELPDFVRTYPCRRGIVSSVIVLSDRAQAVLSALPVSLLTVDAHTLLPVRNLYRTPHTLGTDRLAAVVGAVSLCPDRNLLVIDAGTCITYEFVDASGGYHGGNISPGIWMRLRALYAQTSKLPLVEVTGPCPFVGYNTETAIRSGVLHGVYHEMEGYIRAFRIKYPDLLVFLTGGDNFDFDESIKSIIFADKYLVPRGLNCILDYNDK